jgi:hypothetical protein
VNTRVAEQNETRKPEIYDNSVSGPFGPASTYIYDNTGSTGCLGWGGNRVLAISEDKLDVGFYFGVESDIAPFETDGT